MPSGVYKRTEKHRAAIRAGMEGKTGGNPKGFKPTQKQLDALAARRKLPPTQKQLDALAIGQNRSGHHLSKEHKAKLRAATEGIPKTAEHNAKNSAAQIERLKDPKERAKTSAAKIRLWKDPEYRASMTGEGNPNWQGGIGKLPYSYEWTEELKEFIRERDGRICQLCGKTQEENCEDKRKLTVHHIDYDKENCHPSNLISLCHVCNSKVNFNRNKWQAIFEEINCAWLGT